MNCAESQDLLLDLAYGELEPPRAAEVEAHVAGCATCRAEKAEIDRTRQMAAPLRDLEEPGANFDEPILRAARAEAGMQADGTPGQVVEVAASVKPLGLQPARLDPHARVHGSGRQVPWWKRRGAIIGSTAAAAALAVVVSVSVTRQQEVNRVHEEVAPIVVRAPQALVPQTVDDALAKREERNADETAGSRALRSVAPPAAPAPAQKNDAPPKPVKKLARAASPPEPPAVVQEGRPAPEKQVQRTDQPEDKVAELGTRPSSGGATGAAASVPPPPATTSQGAPPAAAPSSAAAPELAGRLGAAERRKSASAENAVAPMADARSAAPAAQAPAAAETSGVVAGMSKAPAQANAKAPARTADQIEDDAGAARRAGDYARAAALYKQAAALRTQAAPARAAWDMAHAVECLAAGGNVAEAIQTRKELLRSFPDQPGPRAAADSALRTVPLPPDEDSPPQK